MALTFTSVLAQPLLDRCRERAPQYDRDNRFCQEDFDELKAADEVAVTASDGTQTTGRVTRLAATTLRVGDIDVSFTSPLRIERIGDPVWDGIAMGVGVAAMQSVAAQSRLRSGATLAVLYGSIGGLIDAAVKGRTLVYGSPDARGRSSSVRLIPEIDAHRKAVAVAIGFK